MGLLATFLKSIDHEGHEKHDEESIATMKLKTFGSFVRFVVEQKFYIPASDGGSCNRE